jgi:hypothetical protein
VVSGYCFALLLEGGEPADPPGFLTAIPGWREGDEFLAGERLARFRILGIAPVEEDEDDPAAELFDAFWLVEPAE